jgi:hypothetical protein
MHGLWCGRKQMACWPSGPTCEIIRLSGLFRKFTNVFTGPASGRPAFVAQIFNLLYRRFVIGGAPKNRWRVGPGRPQQNAILRYSRLKICATRLQPIRERIYEMEHLVVHGLTITACAGTSWPNSTACLAADNSFEISLIAALLFPPTRNQTPVPGAAWHP